jgi:hypothetical protein
MYHCCCCQQSAICMQDRKLRQLFDIMRTRAFARARTVFSNMTMPTNMTILTNTTMLECLTQLTWMCQDLASAVTLARPAHRPANRTNPERCNVAVPCPAMHGAQANARRASTACHARVCKPQVNTDLAHHSLNCHLQWITQRNKCVAKLKWCQTYPCHGWRMTNPAGCTSNPQDKHYWLTELLRPANLRPH